MESGEECLECRGTVFIDGFSQGNQLIGCGTGSREGEPVGDDLEPEASDQALEGRPGGGLPEQAVVVELGVDEGDVEALMMQELGHFEHRVDVALGWEGNAHRVGLVSIASQDRTGHSIRLG